jgi:putative aldouronate transport system substrate-binding protein
MSRKIHCGPVLLFGFCTAAAVFTGSCGDEKKTAINDDPYYPLSISVYTSNAAQQPNPGNKMYKYLKEKLGVTFEWDILVGDSSQKRGVMIAGGEYPDMIGIGESQFIDAGALIPLEDLIEQYAPNVKRHFADWWEALKSPDGHIYYLCNWGVFHGKDWNPNDMGSQPLWIQKEVLKEAGYPKITTVDEYFDLIISYYKKHPAINGQPAIPFTILTYDYRAFCMWNPPQFLAGYPNDGNGIVDPVSHEYKVFFGLDISKRWFKKLNALNAQGYIDKSAFVDNYDQYMAKLSSGRVLGISDQYWQFLNSEAPLIAAGQYNRTMAPLPIVFDTSIRPFYRGTGISPNFFRGVGISVKAKDPVRIMRFLNDLMSEEVQRTLLWGIEGEDWQWDENHEPYRTPDQRTNVQNQTWYEQNRAGLVRGIFPTWEGSFSDGLPAELGQYPREFLANQKPEDVELWAAYGVSSFSDLLDPEPQQFPLGYPAWSLPNPPDGSDAQLALQRSEQTMRKYLPQIIMAAPSDFERLWSEYVLQLNTNGIGKYEAYMREQLNQRIEDWSRWK